MLDAIVLSDFVIKFAKGKVIDSFGMITGMLNDYENQAKSVIKKHICGDVMLWSYVSQGHKLGAYLGTQISNDITNIRGTLLRLVR